MILPLVALGIAVTSCKDDMDYHEYSIVDKDFIEKNFGNVGGFMTDLYNTVNPTKASTMAAGLLPMPSPPTGQTCTPAFRAQIITLISSKV